MEITLPSGRKIGESHPPFIIAEVGSNWRDFNDCKDAITKAKLCGADAVKFQLYTESALYGFYGTEELLAKPDGKYLMWYDGNKQLDIPGKILLDWLPKLKEKADAVGIEFMCTAFSPELYETVNPYVSIHKIASAECTHKRILEKVRSFGKPVILSTGAHGVEDIGAALDCLGGRNTQSPDAAPIPTVLMYCVAAYPANFVNLRTLSKMRTTFNTLVGYSDHSRDIGVIPESATKGAGAVVLEKHFTTIPEIETPDRPHSLTPDEFKIMVKSIHYTLDAPIGPTLGESPMILRHNRRLIAVRDIQIDEEFQEGINFGIYRSLKDDTHAFHPFMIDEVNGRHAKNKIIAGDGIGPGDV